MSKYFLILFSCIVLMACRQASVSDKANDAEPLISNQPAILTGFINNPIVRQIVLIEDGNDQSAMLQQDNRFSFSVSPSQSQYYILKYSNRQIPVYLKPGDQVNMQINGANRRDPIVFSGPGEIENNYIQQRLAIHGQLTQGKQQNYQLEETEFRKKMDDYLSQMNNHIDDYVQENKEIDPFFVRLEKADCKYFWALEHLNYPRYFSFYGKQPGYKPSEKFSNFLNQINLNDGKVIASENYKQFLVSYTYQELNELFRKDPALQTHENGLTLAGFEVINKYFNNQRIKDHVAFALMQNHLKSYSINQLQPLMAKYQQIAKNPAKIQAIQIEMDKWAALSKGQPAPGFTYLDKNGKKVSLKDFKGKYVYIDIWATWCGPCRKEIPHLEELQKQYKSNKKIVFASVSIDKNKEAWIKMVNEKQMAGIQLIADKAGNSKICQDYQVAGIPRFLLIDHEGKIMNVKAPRPSSTEIKQILADISKAG